MSERVERYKTLSEQLGDDEPRPDPEADDLFFRLDELWAQMTDEEKAEIRRWREGCRE